MRGGRGEEEEEEKRSEDEGAAAAGGRQAVRRGPWLESGVAWPWAGVVLRGQGQGRRNTGGTGVAWHGQGRGAKDGATQRNRLRDLLQSKFLFGYDDPKLVFSDGSSPHGVATMASSKGKQVRGRSTAAEHGKVHVLSIDGGGWTTNRLLDGAALVRLEASL
ncbi:hypothetical protein ABZP36_022601 [Zizania latifolia]